MPSSQTPQHLFVAGVFRSGTSMLYASLNQHPAIALMYEPELQSHDLPQRLFLREKWLENASAWTEFLRRHGFPAYPKEAAEHFHCPEDFYRAYADRKQAIYGGEKSPTLHGYLPQLVKRFPEAKIITISRNPAAVFHSIQEAAKSEPWFGRFYMLERALYGQERLLQDSIQLQNQGHSILHTTYEAFTAAPEVEGSRICDYLGIPFDERMTTLENADLVPVIYSPIHRRLHSQKITPSEFVPPDLSLEWLEMLDAHWQRTRECLAKLSSTERPIPPMAPPAEKIQPSIRKGRFLYNCRRWKRFIHHLLPVELIRIYRAIKFLIRNTQTIDAEKYSPAEILRMQLVFGILILFSLALGTGIYSASHGEVSPIPFFVFPVLVSGWFFGWKPITFFAILGASAWTFGPKLSFSPQMPYLWILWNLLSRSGLLLILGLFAWHLKATLLIQQNQKE